MERSDIRVIDTRGEKGTLEGALPDEASTQITIRLPSGERLLAPKDMLIPTDDGCYRLNGDFQGLRHAPPPRLDPGTTVEEQIVPVVEETVHVEKRVRETGRVRISKQVTERLETVDIPLLHEDVEIERIPVDRILDEPTKIRQEGDVTIIPVFEERLVVQKLLILKEELHVRRRTSTRQESHDVSLRSETVHVERIPTENRSEKEAR